METMTKHLDLKNIDKSIWESFRFEEIAKKVSETVDPNTTDLKVYVGLEHIDAEDIHIKRFGTPADVSGGKLKCYPGDVIFGKRRAYQRKAAIVDFEGICSAHAFVFRANPEVIDHKLFPFFLHSDQFMHRMVDISVGGLSPTINWGDLKHQEFLLPPKDQQAELAELLWAMDEVIESEKEVKNSQELFLKSLEMELFMGKRRLNNIKSDFKPSLIGSFPNDWEVKTIGEISEVKGGKRLPKGYSLQEVDNGHKYITVSDMSYSGINTSKIKFVPEEVTDKLKRYRVESGDIYISVAGTIGIIGMIPKELNGAFLTENADKLINVSINKEYLMHLMRTELVQSQIEALKTTNAQPKLALTRIRNFYITIPPAEEQDYIVANLSENILILENIKLKISCSKSLQKSLINQIF